MEVTCPKCASSMHLTPADVASKERLRALPCGTCGAHFDARMQLARATHQPPAASNKKTTGGRSGVVSPSSSKARAGYKPDGSGLLKKIPAFIGNYQVLQEINRGGMGIVYKAMDPVLKRKVAIKVLLAGEGATESDMLRFQREAEATARLQHPNIVPIYAIGEHEGKPYFVMDFIEGRTAKELKDRGEITPRLALKIIEGAAEALHHAHLNGVFHRDVKPANIIVGEDERAQLMDFGLARRVDEDLEITQSGTTMGTPSYMSPEQAEGRLELVDEQSDVYSAGACLYELLTGRVPFEGATTLSVLRRILEDPPIAPRQLNPAINRDVETICLKCLEKKKASRYATALELAEDIRRFNAGEAIAAKPLGPLGALWRKIRRHRELSIAALVMVLSGLGALAWSVNQAQAARRKALNENYEKLGNSLRSGNELLDQARDAIRAFNGARQTEFEQAAARARDKLAQAEQQLRIAETLNADKPEVKSALERFRKTELEADVQRYIFKAKMFLHPPAGRPGDPPPAPNYAGAEFAAQEAVDRDPKNADARELLREAAGIRKIMLAAASGQGESNAPACEIYARKILDGLGRALPGDTAELGQRLGLSPVSDAELEPGFYIVSFVRKGLPRQQATFAVSREAREAELYLSFTLDAKEENMASISAGDVKMPDGNSTRVTPFAIDRYEFPNKPGQEPLTGVSLVEARTYCEKEGKKLCTRAQWLRACTGETGRRFPYGNDYSSGACATGFDGNAQMQPLFSGQFLRCKTAEGVYDMAGNAAEWADGGSAETLFGGDWTGSIKTPDLSGSCRTNVSVDDVNKDRRGFRCCKAAK